MTSCTTKSFLNMLCRLIDFIVLKATYICDLISWFKTNYMCANEGKDSMFFGVFCANTITIIYTLIKEILSFLLAAVYQITGLTMNKILKFKEYITINESIQLTAI